MIKIGDILYCNRDLNFNPDFTYNFGIELKKGKGYKIIDISRLKYIKIINEKGNYNWYGLSLFSNIIEIRKNKLNILNNINEII